MKRFIAHFFVFLTVFFAYSNLGAVKVTILHTNDSHMNLLPGGPRDTDLSAHQGGIAKFATVIAMYQSENPLVLHAGDFSIGDIMFCKYFCVPELQLMSQIGVNAIALGNHEFDLGPDALTQFIGLGKANPDMKILCANGDFSEKAELDSQIISDTIFTRNTVKIGVFGMTTPETTLLSNPFPVTFSMDKDTVGAIVFGEVKKLRDSGCAIVIMLSHMGYENDKGIAYNIPGINAIVSGHDHFFFDSVKTIANQYTNEPCYIAQVGAFYEYVGKFEFEITDGNVTKVNWNFIPLDENIPDAGPIADILETMKADIENTYGSIAPVYSTKIADVTETINETSRDLKTDGFNDNQVGSLVADAFKAWGGTDLGMTASGMTSHPLYKGPIVGADIYRMMGYGFNTVNTLGFRMVKLEMTGADIMKGLQFGLEYIGTTDDFLLQCSNLFYEYKYVPNLEDPSLSKGQLLINNVRIGGLPVDPTKWYSITTQEGIFKFLDILKEKIGINYKNQVTDPQITEYMVLVGYLSQLKTIVPPKIDRLLNVEESEPIVSTGSILKAYPNPSMTEAKFDFNIDKSGLFSILIYDQHGKIVQNLGVEMFGEGLNTKKISVEKLNSGVYTYIVTNGTQKIMGRFIVLK